jgi:hypothetical protein
MRPFRSPVALPSNSGSDANVDLFVYVPYSTERPPTPSFTMAPAVYGMNRSVAPSV